MRMTLSIIALTLAMAPTLASQQPQPGFALRGAAQTNSTDPLIIVDGVKLTRSLRRLDPNVRVIVSSGHIQKENGQELEALGVEIFLEKPYNADKLLRALRQVLDTDQEKAA